MTYPSIWIFVLVALTAQVAAHEPAMHLKRSALKVQPPAVAAPSATYDQYNVRSDESWWCGLGPVGSPPEFHSDSIYPVNHLFAPAAISKAMAAVVGLGRGNFRKYPGNFMNKDAQGRTLLPDVVLSPGFALKYFPIMNDGTKWGPLTRDASQDAGNFRMVYSTSADKKTVKFHGLVFHPPKSQELRVCIRLTPEQVTASKKAPSEKAPSQKAAPARKVARKAAPAPRASAKKAAAASR